MPDPKAVPFGQQIKISFRKENSSRSEARTRDKGGEYNNVGLYIYLFVYYYIIMTSVWCYDANVPVSYATTIIQ